jgi:hypothetical protein
MKKKYILSAMLLVALAVSAKDRGTHRETYLDLDQVANSVNILPPPPAFGS